MWNIDTYADTFLKSTVEKIVKILSEILKTKRKEHKIINNY